MQNIVRYSVLVAALMVVGAQAQAQEWCAYSPVRDMQFNCGYSSERACQSATRDVHAACTLDPFYG